MYTPSHFAIPDAAEEVAFIRANPFGLLIIGDADGPDVSHLPFLLDDDGDGPLRLRCHVARANRIWRRIEAASNVICVFNGPHAYISPDWYADRTLLPTWNYQAAYVSGTARLLDPEKTRQLVEDLSDQEEDRLRPKQPWKSSKVPSKTLEAMLRAIVGIEVTVERIDLKAKMSQNRGAADRHGAAAALRRLGGDRFNAVAETMEKFDP